MSTSLSLALTAALLAASPSQPGDPGEKSRMDMQVFASAANVLGAATACDRVPRKRLSVAAGEVGALATAKALSIEEVASIERVLMVSAMAGLQALKDGKTDCNKVEASFTDLEKAVLQTPVALRRD
ncbi:MAG TPA: hypothetical protein VJN67_00750 [Stellaceae bacterium]|nr:hypothetical protein [Stellaceae bacterium]